MSRLLIEIQKLSPNSVVHYLMEEISLSYDWLARKKKSEKQIEMKTLPFDDCLRHSHKRNMSGVSTVKTRDLDPVE